jgi:predicted DNA-binding transcriptional regulator YafY
MIKIGPEIEVLDPPELRERLRDAAFSLARLYGG